MRFPVFGSNYLFVETGARTISIGTMTGHTGGHTFRCWPRSAALGAPFVVSRSAPEKAHGNRTHSRRRGESCSRPEMRLKSTPDSSTIAPLKLSASVGEAVDRIRLEDDCEWHASRAFADPLAVVLGTVAHCGDRLEQVLQAVPLP
jgi:hypothetical protein